MGLEAFQLLDLKPCEARSLTCRSRELMCLGGGDEGCQGVEMC